MQIILTASVAWLIAQIIKSVIEYTKTRKFNWKLLMASGGMPSSHTASVVAATTKIGMLEGIMAPLFGACVIFSFVIMYDAVGVRQSVGLQAKALNQIHRKLNNLTSFDCKIIQEVCGHNIFQVIVGFVVGLILGLSI